MRKTTMKDTMKGERSYSELIEIPSYEERLRYLKLGGTVGFTTFGSHRYLNQALYKCPEWLNIRHEIIIRDNGCDLACVDYPIYSMPVIHHINPISIDDVLKKRFKVFDPENLICCSFKTHEFLHYGKHIEDYLREQCFIERKANDTCPWRN